MMPKISQFICIDSLVSSSYNNKREKYNYFEPTNSLNIIMIPPVAVMKYGY
jgi:hypothetical protein